MVKDALKKYFQTFLDSGAALGYLALFCIISFILVYFSGSFAMLTFIATIALLISPAAFAYQGSAAAIHHGSKFSTRYYFSMFVGYFSGSYTGVYRVWSSLLKALAVYLISNTIVTSIAVPIAYSVDPEFVAAVNNYVNSGSIQEMTANLQLIYENATFNLTQIISITISLAFGFYMFMHSIGINSLALYTSFSSKGQQPMNYISYLTRYAFKGFRKPFYKSYYRAIWPIIILYFATFAIGSYVATLFLTNPTLIAMCGLFSASIILLIVSSYYFAILENLYSDYFPYIKSASLELTRKALEEMKRMREMNEMRIKDFEESIEAEEKKLEDEEKTDPVDENPFTFTDTKKKNDPPEDNNDEE